MGKVRVNDDSTEKNQDKNKILSIYKNNVLNYDVGNKKLKEVLDKADWKYSGFNRFYSARILAYLALPDTTDTITVSYKIKDIHKFEKEVTFAMAYVQRKEKGRKRLIDVLEKSHDVKLSESENIYINNLCISGSVISKDGEYRSVILNWNSFRTIIHKIPKMREIYDHIMGYMSEALLERKYMLLTQYYFPTDRLKNKFYYETEILCSSNKINIFIIVWFNFYYTYYFGMISNHLNSIFKDLMLKYKTDDIKFFKSLLTLFDVADLDHFRYICSNYVKGEKMDFKIYNKTKIGQKIIPLNLLEAQNFFNIEYMPWKEYIINTKVADLVINNITNGFSLCGGWFLVKTSDGLLYDNPSQSDRLEKSAVAVKIAELLSQAKLFTYNNINKMDENDPEFIDTILYNMNNNDITTWLSDEFKVVYSKIQEVVNRTKEYIIMSNVSFGIFTEFVGKTLYDAIFFTKQSSYYKKLVPNIFGKENKNNFRKYMFQLCYNLYCINSKLHIIHGDLHLNNITLNSIFYKKNVKIDIENPQILYVIDKENQYIFSNNFYDLCVIDFSRAILNPEKYEHFKIEHIPYNLIHNKSQFLKRQLNDLLEYLYSTKPEYKEMAASIESSAKYHYNEYFKLLTVLDLYNLTDRFISFLKINGSVIGTVCKESVALIYQLNKSSDFYLNTVLNKLIMNQSYEEVNNMEFPILTILKDVFEEDRAEYHGSLLKGICDMYNYNNDAQYSLSSYKNFPPYLKNISKNFIDERKKYENKMFQNFQTINIIQTRQLEKNL